MKCWLLNDIDVEALCRQIANVDSDGFYQELAETVKKLPEKMSRDWHLSSKE